MTHDGNLVCTHLLLVVVVIVCRSQHRLTTGPSAHMRLWAPPSRLQPPRGDLPLSAEDFASNSAAETLVEISLASITSHAIKPRGTHPITSTIHRSL